MDNLAVIIVNLLRLANDVKLVLDATTNDDPGSTLLVRMADDSMWEVSIQRRKKA